MIIINRENISSTGMEKNTDLEYISTDWKRVKIFKPVSVRSEEHTSELQSRPHLVCRLLLEKKKKKEIKTQIDNNANNRIVKVSATRKNKVPTRSIDQGAHAV